MKKLVLIILGMVFTFSMMYSSLRLIDVTTNQKPFFKRGVDNVDIRWTTTAVRGNVMIKLVKVGSSDGVIIAQNRPFNRSPFRWQIPNDFALGSYIVKVFQSGPLGIVSGSSLPIEVRSGMNDLRTAIINDLEIKDISFRKEGNVGYITAKIRNNGNEFHGDVFYSIDLLWAQGAASKKVFSSARLDLIRRREVNVDVWKIDPKIFKVTGRKVKIMVDNKNLIAETNERNNIMEKMVKIEDLVLSDISLRKERNQKAYSRRNRPNSTYTGPKMNCRYTIYVNPNNPIVEISRVKVAYRLDNLSSGRNGAWEFMFVRPGKSERVSFSLNSPPEGRTENYKIWVKVDPDNEFLEINERNNNSTHTFSIEHFTNGRRRR